MMNIAFMSIIGVVALMKQLTRNAAVSITTPPRITFLRPSFDETIPIGM